MDKLKPIIEQKFWIFLGLALILPFVGWYLAASDYAEGVQQREDLIEGTFKKMQISGNVPNQDWVDGADEIVKQEQQKFEAAQKKLWRSQRLSMDWPPDVQPFMANVPYQGEIDSTVREYYSRSYFDQLRKIEQRLRPFDYETGEGVLLFDPSSYTHVPELKWVNLAPTSSEMWNAQIDTWLVRAVFESIISINQDIDKITEAPVRQLLELTLRGGDRDYAAATASGGEYSGEISTSEGMFGDMSSSGSSEYGGGGAGFSAEVRFDLSEELGPAGTGGYSADMSGSGELDAMFASGDDSGGDSAPSAAVGPGRYVDDDEAYPFRTRAFVLGVVMDHGELPRFMSELSRSDWPIQIIRVQTRALNLDELPPSGQSGASSSMGTRGRMSRGFGPSGYNADASEGYSGSGGRAFDPSSSGEGYGPSYSSSPGSSYLGSRPGVPSGIGNSNAQGLVQQAMSDPKLAEVWIGGLITMFRPMDETDDSATGGSQSPDTTQGTGVSNDASGTAPNAVQPGSAPAEGQGTNNPVPADNSTTTPDTTAPGTGASADPPPSGPETPAPQTTP